MKKMLILLLVLLLNIAGAAAESDVHYIDGQTADRVHLRISPDRDSESLGLYFTGTPVQQLMVIANGWTQVRIGSEKGYILSSLLSDAPVTPAAPVYETHGGSGGWVNLRASAYSRGDVIARVDNGTQVRILGETASGWYYVDAGMQTGYMMTKYLRKSDRPLRQQTTEIVGRATNGDYIHCFTAVHGQRIYFTAMDESPIVEYADVNFDDAADLTILISLGASNAFYEFFVWDGQQYVWAEHPSSEYGLCNYSLDVESGLVVSHANNGGASALHEICLYRWNGSRLALVRRAVSENLTVTEFSQGAFTRTTYHDMIQVTVCDYTMGVAGGHVLWEQTAAMDDLDYAKEQAILWEGLR